jgi:uncharacterized protein YbjT (DUF2867 family)
MRLIDVDAVVAVAASAKAAGAKRLGVVSSMGASASSTIFYSRIKGEMEDKLLHMGFVQTVIAQPSQLSGPRDALGQPDRVAERMTLAVMQWLRPVIPANYRTIKAKSVALALRDAVALNRPGVCRLLSGQMQRPD